MRPAIDRLGVWMRKGLSLVVITYLQRESLPSAAPVFSDTCTRVAVLVQKQFHFSYTPYIEDCCKTVSDTAIEPYDKYLFYIIQLQHSVDKIDQLSARHASELGTPGSGAELYVTSLIADLEAFQIRLPFEISDLREWSSLVARKLGINL